MRRVLRRQPVADWLMLIGGLVLFISLFLTWSHQLPPTLLDAFAGSAAIQGVPRDPTAWQVYSVADILLAVLAVALVVVALRGRSRRLRATVLLAVAVGLAFTIHAQSAAPTNGLLLVDPRSPPGYLPHQATPGAGEVVAIVALALAGLGVLLSLVGDLSSMRVRHQR